jgi:hypothetical protein
MSRCARGVVRTRAIERVEVATDRERGDSKGREKKLEGVGITQPARHGPYQLRLLSESKTSPGRQRALQQNVYRRKSIFAANARQPTESLR